MEWTWGVIGYGTTHLAAEPRARLRSCPRNLMGHICVPAAEDELNRLPAVTVANHLTPHVACAVARRAVVGAVGTLRAVRLVPVL